MLRKPSAVTAALSFMLVGFLCQFLFAGENEEAAIREVIEKETKFAFEHNFEEFSKTWVHEPYAVWTNVGNYYSTEYIGWDSIGAFFSNWFEQAKTPFTEEVIRKNLVCRIYGDGAWVTFDQYYKSDMEKNPEISPNREIRVLEKTNEGWKLACMESIDKNSYSDTERDLNHTGYILLDQNKVKEAIAVFNLNVKSNPGSSNVYDSLGEAYLKDGNKEMAIKNYEKSLEIEPDNDNEKMMIGKLKE